MRVEIRNNRSLYFDQLTPQVEELLKNWFSVRDPDYRYQIGLGSDREWDGWIRKYDAVWKRLPLTFLKELREKCQRFRVPLTVVDKRPPPRFVADFARIRKDMLPGIELEDYQLRAIRAACQEECGVLQSCTGSGKSEMMAGIIKVFNCPTVVLAEQTVVIDQLKERLELRDVTEEVGLFYAGETPEDKLVCVGTSASVFIPPKPRKEEHKAADFLRLQQARQTRVANAERYRALIKGADLLLVDEADAGITMTHRNIFRYWFNGRRRYGVTATPFDPKKPVQGLRVRELYGPVIVEIPRQEVEKCGRIVPIKYAMLAIGEDGDKWEASAWDVALRERIVDCPSFHALVAKIVRAFPGDGTLILVEINDLGRALEEAIPGSVFVHGLTARGRRRELFKEFEDRRIKCLIGGKIIKRGFDLKGGCENLVLCGMGQLSSDLLQQIGRAMRCNSRGRARVFDFYCLHNRYLYDHSKERLKAVVKAGFDAHVQFHNGSLTGAELLARRFRIP